MRITPEDIRKFDNSELSELFNTKLTENGDDARISCGNSLFDIFFQTEYLSNHLNKVVIGQSQAEKVLAMFVRDPRKGYGKRDLGRVLMGMAGVQAEDVAKCGRFDDLWETPDGHQVREEWLNFLFEEAKNGNNLAKKWMPHYVGKNKGGKVAKSTLAAARMRRLLGLDKQQWNRLVKTDTVESKLSQHMNDSIEFDKLPSLALLKYWARFAGTGKNNKTDMAERFNEYLESVKKGDKKMNMSTVTVYDIYRNMDRIDPDLAFAQIPSVKGSWIPVVDTSGSMHNANDSFGKAMAIGHYLAKNSTYCPNQAVSFSSRPKLLSLSGEPTTDNARRYCTSFEPAVRRLFSGDYDSAYRRELQAMYTGDYTNTDFGAVMKLFSGLKTEFPEYIIVLSDMEFDRGSSPETKKLMAEWAEKGVKTKLIWWNLNERSATSPESVRTDASGNLFISGYNPTLLGFLECGFSMYELVSKVLTEYSEKIGI